TPIVLRPREGRLAFDKIDTTINAGQLQLEPELVVDEARGLSLHLGPGSRIENARINDEVSRRVLAFVAPVLEQATRARGAVSVDLDDAVFPIAGGSGKGMRVDGSVVFDDVEFVPGPLVDVLLGVIGRDNRPTPSLRLNEPVALRIVN